VWTFQLFVVDNCIEDWRIALSLRRVLQLTVELVVCSLHPPPGAFYFEWQPVHHHTDDQRGDFAGVVVGGIESRNASRLVPIDAILALPMFLRLYLVCR